MVNHDSKIQNPLPRTKGLAVPGGKKLIGVVIGMVFLFAAAAAMAQAGKRQISLKNPKGALQQFVVQKNQMVEFSNPFKTHLYDIVIIQVNSGKKMVGIKDFPPGQSMALEFSKEGPYILCYSRNADNTLLRHMCLQINVMSFQPA